MRAVGRACPPPGIIALGEHAPRIAVGAGRKWGGEGEECRPRGDAHGPGCASGGHGERTWVGGKGSCGRVRGAASVCGARTKRACADPPSHPFSCDPVRFSFFVPVPGPDVHTGLLYTPRAPPRTPPCVAVFFFFITQKRNSLLSLCVSLSLTLSVSCAAELLRGGGGLGGGACVFFFFFCTVS